MSPVLPRVPNYEKSACVPKLMAVTDRALRGDTASIEQLRLLGEALMLVGGVEALVTLQGALHNHAVERWRDGARGDAISTWWEHIPEWVAL
jgi:hypothetical protein